VASKCLQADGVPARSVFEVVSSPASVPLPDCRKQEFHYGLNLFKEEKLKSRGLVRDNVEIFLKIRPVCRRDLSS
jgi:hypothetical protein